MEEYKTINNYLHSAVIEAVVEDAKSNDKALGIAKFKYVPDIENGFFFKEIVKELYKMLSYPTIWYEDNYSFIVLLKDKKLHESIVELKKSQNHIYNEHGIRIDRVGVTTLSKEDSAEDLLKRVNRYFVISKRLQIGRIIYGTREFDFFDERKREDTFLTIAKKDADIRLYNLYKGIPVSEEGKIVEINEHMACINTTYEELLYLKKFEEFVYIKHKGFPNIIKGKIFNFNFDKLLVCIKDIEFLDESVLDREHIRIKPQKRIYITIGYKNSTIASGVIQSISIDSIVVKINKNIIKKLRALQKLEFTLQFKLLAKSSLAIETLNVKAKIYKIIGDEIIFTLFPNSFVQTKISGYVTSVKASLMKELKQKIIIN